ncbi:MAG: MinD/ParA family protein [Candidatus Eisenbacteria sp.]|nr:MinD/ParA family protein [Candidatus Eisenbacteria bacterium]
MKRRLEEVAGSGSVEINRTGRQGWGPGWDPELPVREEQGLLAIAVTSGKGGVGKTNLVTNLAVLMAEMGRRVLLLDGDLSLANVDLLMGLIPRYNLYDVVMGRKRIDEVTLAGPADIRIIPASSGVEEMANLDDYRREVLVRSLEVMAKDRDVLLIDTGSGIHLQNLRLAQMADEILVVTTPEPTAFSDAYAIIKILSGRRLARPPRLVVNMVSTEAEGHRTARRVARVARQFLGFEPELYGVIPMDEVVPRAVKAQEPFVKVSQDAAATVAVHALAQRLLQPSGTPTQVPRPQKQRVARAA